jgi:hypothetical protein
VKQCEISDLRGLFDAWRAKPENASNVEIHERMEHLLSAAESASHKADAEDSVWRITAAEFFNEARQVAILAGIERS